jgi:hypothetical protein
MESGISYLLVGGFLIGGFVLWWKDALPIESVPYVGQVLRIIGAPATVFCGQAAAGKSSFLEFLKDHPVPQYRRTYTTVTRLIVFHRIDGDKKVVLRNVHDVPAERLDILSIDIERLKPRLVLAILDGSVVALDGMDDCASNPLARHPARLIFDQLELSLRAHGAALSVKVIGVLINKADLWCSDDRERRRVVNLVEERLRAYPLLGHAVRQGQIEVFVRAIALIRPRNFETPDALEDIARHSARLSNETLMEFKGRADDIIAQAAGGLRVAQTLLEDVARRGRR